MNRKWEIAIASFLVLALLATLCFGCAKKEQEEKAVITIGIITDITGPAGGPCKPYGWAIEDLAKHINAVDPIPGVELRTIMYDGRYDPSRDIPGYEWCKERGAELIITPLPPTADTLKPFAARDKVPVLIQSASESALDPPGWVFAYCCPSADLIKPLVKWIGEQWPNYPTKIKIGSAGWAESYHADITRGIREYCQAHPDKFEYIAGFLAPMGTVTWGGEIEKLRECDYICLPSTGLGIPTFVTDARARGYTGEFFCTDAVGGYVDLMVGACGWEALDGVLTAYGTLYWNEPCPVVDLAKALLNEYRAGEVQATIATGTGYSSPVVSCSIWFAILREAIAEVGAENFDGGAFYDTATKFKMTLEGYEETGYTESVRYALKHVVIYKWSAADQDLVRVSGWLPLVD